MNGASRLLVRQHGILYLHLYWASVTIKLLNETLKLNFSTVCRRHKTIVCYALLVTYGVSGALEKLELELVSAP